MGAKSLSIAVLLLCGAALAGAQAPCTGTPAYSPCDFAFELSEAEAAAHPNPYATVRLHAEFRSPRFRTYLMPAFWDGGRRMVIRFTPVGAGEWTYRVTSNVASFEGKQGTFTAEASDAPGFIVARNVHHWAWTEGDRPHLWMGDTLYRFAAIDEALFQGIVDTRAHQKFNHMRGLVLSQETSAQAFPEPDRVNPEYFRNLDARIAYMNSRGIVADLILAGDENHLVEVFPDRTQRERYIRYLAARYAPMNITWQGVQEYEEYADGRGIAREIGEVLKDADPYQHPRTTHTTATSAPLLGDGWMSYVAYQTSDSNIGAVERQLYAAPFVNLEFGYEDSGAGKSHPHHVDTDTFRRRLWNSTMDGQYPTFGNTGTYGGRKFAVDPKYLDSPGARQMTAWYDFFAATRHWELEPYFDVDGGRALALEGVEYIVYVEKPGPVELLVERHGYDVAWVNPITGERIRQKNWKGERFTGEPPNASHDWVLHISREGRKEGMLRSYKFESRRILKQEIEQNPLRVPFEIEQPSEDTLRVGQTVPHGVKITRETRATRSMLWLWTGEVAAGGQGYRVLGTGATKGLRVPAGLTQGYPATLLVRLYGMNANGKVYSLYKPYQLAK
jgi:hypothetical protein